MTTSPHATLPSPTPRTGKPTDANLDPDSWHESISGGMSPAAVAARVASGEVPRWLEAVTSATRAGDEVLELGSGTGELSAALARLGRRVTLVDFSRKSLEFAAEVFAALDLDGDAFAADVLKPLPFADGQFDCVWSGGLLEHFSDDEIAHIVRESARVCRGQVVSLVPNAGSLPYRLGKWTQEREGRWVWGHEDPKHSLAEVFRGAGLTEVREWTVAPEHAAEFLDSPELAPLREHLRAFFAALTPDDLARLGQGYLLVTVGSRAG